MCRRIYEGHCQIATLQLPIQALVILAGMLLAYIITAPAAAQTVQLPTFSSFSVDTSVSIPDSGGAYSEAARRARQQPFYPGLKPAGAGFGGYKSARTGQGGHGVISSAITGSGLSVHATIHDPPSDHGTSRSHANTNVNVDHFATALAATRASTAGRPAPSVKHARRLWLAEQQRRTQRTVPSPVGRVSLGGAGS